MRLVTFLNELSHPTDQISEAAAKASVTKIIKILRGIKKIRPMLELHSASPLPTINIGAQRTLSSLGADGNTREEWQFLRGLQNRAFDLVDEVVDLSVDYEHEGVRCVGLGLAHAFESLAVSFEGEQWNGALVKLLCRSLNAEGDLNESTVFTRHVSQEAHLLELQDWLKAVPFELFENGEELWRSREINFPSLRFLPRTEQQLISLQNGSLALSPINFRLWQLECSAQSWKIGSSLPPFLSKVTPEHEQRKRLCQFESTSSGVKSFDLHARYTPGAGRIHIWCNPGNRTIEIGHIGKKL